MPQASIEVSNSVWATGESLWSRPGFGYPAESCLSCEMAPISWVHRASEYPELRILRRRHSLWLDMGFANTEAAEFLVTARQFMARARGASRAHRRLTRSARHARPVPEALGLGCGLGVWFRRDDPRAWSAGGTRQCARSGHLCRDVHTGDFRELPSSGYRTWQFLHGDVQVHKFGQSSFDRAYSRFGVMFFADPVAAFTNVRRALRPGGSLAFSCWQNVFENEWMLVPAAAAMSVTGTTPPMPGPDEPGPFSLADPDRTRYLLKKAGFGDVEVLSHNDSVVVPEADVPTVAAASHRVGAVAELLMEADPETTERVVSAIENTAFVAS